MTPSSFILIVDFGSQFTQLIARRIREIGVYSKIIPFHLFKQEWNDSKPNGVILSGSPYSTLSEKSPRLPSDFFSLGVPVLGICYGQQLMCMELGGKVESHDSREYGRSFLEITEECPIFEGIWEKGTCHQIWMSHGDRVVSIPQGFKVVGVSSGSPFAAIADEERNFYALQFHPEVVHTPDGIKILKNFVCNIAGVAPNWTMAVCRETAIERIREQAKGEGKILCALSGGVDSSVAALLVHQAIGNRLVCVFVDHGMMRKDEAKEVMDMFKNYSDLSLIFVDASDRFVKALEGETDPEAKRKIIGKSFIEVFEEEAKKIGGAEFLVQGTLYPDVIESVSFSGGPSVTVKSHHNVGGLPERMNMKLIEPLRELFKDEVRNLGRSLGLPEAFIGRHPFPGPGLAVRCLGPVCQEKLEILRNADAIFLDEIRKAGLYDAIWQAFVVLLPVRSVGVMGDDRTYEYVCSLRAVTSVDGMTADFYPFDMTFLSAVSTRIINEVPGINRVVYDVTSKPPGTIEWE